MLGKLQLKAAEEKRNSRKNSLTLMNMTQNIKSVSAYNFIKNKITKSLNIIFVDKKINNIIFCQQK